MHPTADMRVLLNAGRWHLLDAQLGFADMSSETSYPHPSAGKTPRDANAIGQDSRGQCVNGHFSHNRSAGHLRKRISNRSPRQIAKLSHRCDQSSILMRHRPQSVKGIGGPGSSCEGPCHRSGDRSVPPLTRHGVCRFAVRSTSLVAVIAESTPLTDWRPRRCGEDFLRC